MTYRRHRKKYAAAKSDSLPLRFAAALLILAAVLAIRYHDPTLLETLRVQMTADTGAVAEAFARFTDTVGEGEPVAEAWTVLTDNLSHLASAEPEQ